ncbi:Titin [Labeo rohita]|uniref:Titin n=1 Tax=Labeo rohita TaxID=84645 RepID=A0ABQ8MIM9_LABRO|nr:Titin [Labeo rohita]
MDILMDKNFDMRCSCLSVSSLCADRQTDIHHYTISSLVRWPYIYLYFSIMVLLQTSPPDLPESRPLATMPATVEVPVGREGAEDSIAHCTAAEGEQCLDLGHLNMEQDLIDFSEDIYVELPACLDFPPTLPMLCPPIVPVASVPPPLSPDSPAAYPQPTTCAVRLPQVCQSPSASWLEDPSSPPPASESRTPPWPSDPAAPPRLSAPSSPLSPVDPLAPPGSLSLRLRLGWSSSRHRLSDSIPPAVPRHSVPPAPLGSSLPPALPQSSVAPALLQTSGSPPRSPEPWFPPGPTRSSVSPRIIGSSSPHRAPPPPVPPPSVGPLELSALPPPWLLPPSAPPWATIMAAAWPSVSTMVPPSVGSALDPSASSLAPPFVVTILDFVCCPSPGSLSSARASSYTPLFLFCSTVRGRAFQEGGSEYKLNRQQLENEKNGHDQSAAIKKAHEMMMSHLTFSISSLMGIKKIYKVTNLAESRFWDASTSRSWQSALVAVSEPHRRHVQCVGIWCSHHAGGSVKEGQCSKGKGPVAMPSLAHSTSGGFNGLASLPVIRLTGADRGSGSGSSLLLTTLNPLNAPFLDPRGHQLACTGKRPVSREEACSAFQPRHPKEVQKSASIHNKKCTSSHAARPGCFGAPPLSHTHSRWEPGEGWRLRDGEMLISKGRQLTRHIPPARRHPSHKASRPHRSATFLSQAPAVRVGGDSSPGNSPSRSAPDQGQRNWNLVDSLNQPQVRFFTNFFCEREGMTSLGVARLCCLGSALLGFSTGVAGRANDRHRDLVSLSSWGFSEGGAVFGREGSRSVALGVAASFTGYVLLGSRHFWGFNGPASSPVSRLTGADTSVHALGRDRSPEERRAQHFNHAGDDASHQVRLITHRQTCLFWAPLLSRIPTPVGSLVKGGNGDVMLSDIFGVSLDLKYVTRRNVEPEGELSEF